MPAPLAETIISRPFDHASGPWIERIRVNRVSRIEREGRLLMVKTRRRRSWAMLALANFFFSLAHTRTRALSNVSEWQAWEIESFTLLHGPERCAFAENRSVLVEVLPGESLAAHLEQGTFAEEMLDAAGRELRRAHQFRSPGTEIVWSHADANLANFLFDPAEKRARLIDFELQHTGGLPASQRHVEDLLVFLQDLAGHSTAEQLPFRARRFLAAYNHPGLLELLRTRLHVPGGFAGIWWRIRCNHLPIAEVRRRFGDLLRNL